MAIHMVAKFTGVPEDKREDFRQAGTALVDATANEEGTLSYGFYEAEDGEFTMVESYRDSDAVLAHMGNVESELGAVVEAGGMPEINVFGDPSAELAEAAAAFQPSVHSPITVR